MAAKVVLLNSGGIDSRVSAARLKLESGMEVHSLFIDWAPLAQPDVGIAAALTAELYCESHEVFPWAVDWNVYHERLNKTSMTWVNIAYLALAIPYSQKVGASYIATGLRYDSYAWGVEDVFRAYKTLINHNRAGESAGALWGRPAKVFLTPVYQMGAHDVTVKANELGVDLDTTWSCVYTPHCGDCNACKRRKMEGVRV